VIADMNRNGKADLGDVMLIMQKAAGLRP
jgi:hypothetical protein